MTGPQTESSSDTSDCLSYTGGAVIVMFTTSGCSVVQMSISPDVGIIHPVNYQRGADPALMSACGCLLMIKEMQKCAACLLQLNFLFLELCVMVKNVSGYGLYWLLDTECRR